jgi:hypothetical protein
LLVEVTQTLLDGHLDEGRAAVRSCINATIGFEKPGAALGRSPRARCGCSVRPAIPPPKICSGLRRIAGEASVRLQIRAVA